MPNDFIFCLSLIGTFYFFGLKISFNQHLRQVVSLSLLCISSVCLFYIFYDPVVFQKSNWTSQNSSMASIQASVAAIICLSLLQTQKSNWQKVPLIISLCIFIGLLLLLQSRTAVIALIGAAFYVCYPRLRSSFSQNKLLFIGLGALLLITFSLALLVKLDSSAGRWFIWKNAFQLFKEHWLTGVGIGKFNPAYNHLQAEYFSRHSLYSSEAMLADDGYFAFNEWLHIAVEQGVIGLIISVSLTFLLLKACFQNIHGDKSIAGGVIVNMFISCLFSYPLHNWVLLAVTAFFAGMLLQKRNITNGYKVTKWRNKMIFVLAVLLFSFIAFRHFQSLVLFNKSKELKEEGFKTEAYRIASGQTHKLKSHPAFTIFYLQLLYETGRLEEALKWFDIFHPYHCNQKAHGFVGKIYLERGDSKRAEEHLYNSLYITPHLLQSRMDLVEFYNQQGDKLRARYWANEVINFPPKINSSKAIYLKQQAEKYISGN